MSEPAGAYIPLDVRSRLRTQAWKAWIVGLFVVGFWVVLILAAPLAKANVLGSISTPLYSFFSYLCHQMPNRSFHLAGEQFAVCTRCFGVYLGLVAGFVIYPLWRRIDDAEPITKLWLFLSLVPVTIDWSLTFFGIWENNDLSRFITGLILGIACATYIVPAIVEITRNLSMRRGTF